MGRVMVAARLGLGLLLLALLLPMQVYSNQATLWSTLTAPHPANPTLRQAGGALLSTASFFILF
ncbi:unnamed protein product [Nyctereutes procyonoides]|uniref:(raccoon dog) hypothetical protein n=1 Tax=Nyctereutes procyonoides TaxID=34880 RepID=A0A811YEI0_NYCPR|nr:unnamed protein product [Nyctereutes procyonoides]